MGILFFRAFAQCPHQFGDFIESYSFFFQEDSPCGVSFEPHLRLQTAPCLPPLQGFKGGDAEGGSGDS